MRANQTIESLPPPRLREAVAALWRIRPPGPPNLFKAPEFVRLCETCASLYPNAPSGPFALSHAVDALGLPCRPPPAALDLALPSGTAAARLHAAFEGRQARKVYLCPLDNADHLPNLSFGPNRIARFSAGELEELIDQPRLRRINAAWTFDSKIFSKFTWLVIEATCPLDRTPAERANPAILLLEKRLDHDWDAIEPHRSRFPDAVEKALFAVLLAPWEDWVDVAPGQWRPFEVPWVYSVDDDLFVRPPPPPSASTLSWDYSLDDDGEEIFIMPERVRLKRAQPDAPDDAGAELRNWLNNDRWADLGLALKSPLFETPVQHFFVKAFLEKRLDEFLAHMLTIEAALGLERDYPRKGQSRQPKGKGATKLVAARVSRLLSSKDEGSEYCRLFNLRSTFLHGRTMHAIPGETRLKARRLAREVVQKLVETALTRPPPASREAYLRSLES